MTSAARILAPAESSAQAIIGESEVIRGVRSIIGSVAPTRLPVLIQGATGTGKELVAAALHSQSGRRGAFVPFNVCAISESMFEDALFGHVRGAFTGAVHDVPGFLREANAGTAFLDEVSGLPTGLQAKLLRAIETGVFRPVGARDDARSDFRVIAASNESLGELIHSGRFRADLAHRIGAVTIEVPPLCDRLDDIPLLARHFLDRAGFSHLHIEAEALELFAAYGWPGNIRELRHVIECAAVLSNETVGGASVRLALSQRATRAVVERHDHLLVERHRLRRLLEEHLWDTATAAQQLGVHRATLYRRMKRVGLAAPLM